MSVLGVSDSCVTIWKYMETAGIFLPETLHISREGASLTWEKKLLYDELREFESHPLKRLKLKEHATRKYVIYLVPKLVKHEETRYSHGASAVGWPLTERFTQSSSIKYPSLLA